MAAKDADGFGGVAGTCGSAAVAAGGGFGGFFEAGAFAGGEEEIRLDGVLLGVEVVVAATKRIKGFVRAALDDPPHFDD